MSTVTKEIFLTQKINNFIIFIKEKLGEDNAVHCDFVGYSKDLNSFLQAIISLRQIGPVIDETLVKKYLELKGIKKELSAEDLKKINAYFSMFVKVISA